MPSSSFASLSDHDLLVAVDQAATVERRATATLLALLAEVDTRRLHLPKGYSSLFQYAVQRLRLSEAAAYSRVTAARVARRFPLALQLIDRGEITLTTVVRIAAHLTDDNHESVLEAARGLSRVEVDRLIARLHPQPDIAFSVKALPRRGAEKTTTMFKPPAAIVAAPTTPAVHTAEIIAPLAPRRYLLRVTIDEPAFLALQKLRALLDNARAGGDAAAVVSRALALLLEQMERSKCGLRPEPGRTRQAPPHRPDRVGSATSRHVPAVVRRAVWARDEGRCAFVGSSGRCAETRRLEFHHVIPFASGGPTSVENLALRCRAHNAFEGGQLFGDRWRRDQQPTLSGQS